VLICLFVYGVCIAVFTCDDILLLAGIKAGLQIDDFAPRLSFFWGIGMNFYMASVCSMSALFCTCNDSIHVTAR